VAQRLNIAAGVLGIGFALLHGFPSLSALGEPEAPRGSHQRGAIPVWARALWLLLALITLVGSIAHLISNSIGSATAIGIGAVGIWLLAIANGVWIHGRPTITHHLVRGVVVAALAALAFL
jgi:hypothetical protein